jgi:antitoxin component YwqK of YwqJK toxin-antitoxin module
VIWTIVAIQCIASYAPPDSIWEDSTRTAAGLLLESKSFIGKHNQMIVHRFELNGKPHGKRHQWFVSGRIESIDNYKNGLLVDTSTGYFESGELSGRTICDSNGDSCTWISYLPNGNVCGGGQSKKGTSVGKSWSKYPDGKWRQISEYDDNGRKDGLHAHWDSLGRPIDSIVYIHGEILRSSRWYPNTSQLYNRWSYDSTDVVARKADQRVLEASVFGPDGKSWGKVVNGNGAIRFFYEGKLDGTETYKGGVMVKSTHKYLDDGSLNPQYKKKGKR